MVGKMDAVGFIIKSMVERDPSKRRVKPSQQALEDFDGVDLEGSSSDDSDFKIDDDKMDHDDDEDLDSNVSADDADGDEDSSSEDSDSSDDDEDAGSHVVSSDTTLAGARSHGTSVRELIARTNQSSTSRAVRPLKVCCVCLGTRSLEHNEIIECDNCHLSVHEECYGTSDALSVSSSGGGGGGVGDGSPDSTTEPWFCEACRSGVASLQCDLCPVLGGLLKRTDTGRWVHLVCALYIPGVAFVDLDRLTSVTLFEVAYSRWGSKICSLCEDPLLARTGVTVQCDAGMCKVTFHVTCAQRHGLLEEVRHEELGADPYFAHCRAHSDKTAVRQRKANFAAMQQYMAEPHAAKMDARRLAARLARTRASQRAVQTNETLGWTPTMKLLRPVASSAYLCRMLVRRAELRGAETLSAAVTSTASGGVGGGASDDVAKKWHIPPAFSAEFVNYFMDRGGRLASLKQQLVQLLAERQLLEDRDKRLSINRRQIDERVAAARQMGALLRSEVNALYDSLSRLTGEQLKRPTQLLLAMSPSKKQRRSSGMSSLHGAADGGGSDAAPTDGSSARECVQCGGGSSERGVMVVCDSCERAYHRQCLQTPLSRLTRRSRTDAWRCWRCIDAATASDSPHQSSGTRSKRLRQPTELFQGSSPLRPRYTRKPAPNRRRAKCTDRRARQHQQLKQDSLTTSAQIDETMNDRVDSVVTTVNSSATMEKPCGEAAPDVNGSQCTSALQQILANANTTAGDEEGAVVPNVPQSQLKCGTSNGKFAESSIGAAEELQPVSSGMFEVDRNHPGDHKPPVMSPNRAHCSADVEDKVHPYQWKNSTVKCETDIQDEQVVMPVDVVSKSSNTESINSSTPSDGPCGEKPHDFTSETVQLINFENKAAMLSSDAVDTVVKNVQEPMGDVAPMDTRSGEPEDDDQQMTATHIVVCNVVADPQHNVFSQRGLRRRSGRPPWKYITDLPRLDTAEAREEESASNEVVRGRPRGRPRLLNRPVRYQPTGRRRGRPRGALNRFPRGMRGVPSRRRRRGRGRSGGRFSHTGSRGRVAQVHRSSNVSGERSSRASASESSDGCSEDDRPSLKLELDNSGNDKSESKSECQNVSSSLDTVSV